MINPFNFLPTASYEVVTAFVKENGPTVVGSHVPTKFVLVYGTLRLGAGNYSYYLRNKSIWRGTVKLKGFYKSLGLSCKITGNPLHQTVFDIFEIPKNDNFKSTNTDLDILEGTLQHDYTTLEDLLKESHYMNMFLEVDVPIGNGEFKKEVVKFYNVNISEVYRELEPEGSVDYYNNGPRQALAELERIKDTPLVGEGAVESFMEIYKNSL